MRRAERRIVLVLAIVAVVAAPVFGPARAGDGTVPEPGPTAKPLTLEDALRIARERGREIRRAAEYGRQVEARYIEEFSEALPHLSLYGSFFRTRDELQSKLSSGLFPKTLDTRTAELGLTQVIWAWGKVASGIRAAKQARETAAEQMEMAAQGTVRDVSAAFHDVLLAKEMEVIAEESLRQKQRHLDEARRKLVLGTATDYDVLAAEVALENARPETIRASNAVTVARERLRFLLALPAGPIEVRGDLQVETGPAPSYDEVLETARQRRADLRDVRHRVELYRQLVKVYRAEDKPRLDFNASYAWSGYRTHGATTFDVPTGGGTTTFGGVPDSIVGAKWAAGIVLSWPLFDGRRTAGKVARARSDLALANLEEEGLLDGIALEVRVAVDAVREAGEIVRALQGTVTQAQRLVEMAEKGYEFGVKTHLEVDDAQLNLRLARGNLARAQRDYRVALVQLDWVQGTL